MYCQIHTAMAPQALLWAAHPLAEYFGETAFSLAVFRNSPFVSETILFNFGLLCMCNSRFNAIKGQPSLLSYQLEPEWRAIVWPWTWLNTIWMLLNSKSTLWHCCTLPSSQLEEKSTKRSSLSVNAEHKNMPKPKVIMWAQKLWK